MATRIACLLDSRNRIRALVDVGRLRNDVSSTHLRNHQPRLRPRPRNWSLDLKTQEELAAECCYSMPITQHGPSCNIPCAPFFLLKHFEEREGVFSVILSVVEGSRCFKNFHASRGSFDYAQGDSTTKNHPTKGGFFIYFLILSRGAQQ